MNNTLLKEIEGLDFFKDFFVAGIYEDGREIDQERPFLIRVGLDHSVAGSSYVQYQGCTLSCHVDVKTGYYDPKQCIRFRFSKEEVVPRREIDFVRAVLQDFSARHTFIDPKSLVFDTEYQLQLVNTCDGFFLGAALMAITAALRNTVVPRVSVESTDIDDLEEKFKQGLVVKKKSRFVFDATQPLSLTLRDTLVYAGFIVFFPTDDEPIFLVDPPNECLEIMQPRFDIVIGASSGRIYFWQSSGFEDVGVDLRKRAFDQAKAHASKMSSIYEKVDQNGNADSEEFE